MWVLEIFINGAWKEIERSSLRRALLRRAANINEYETRVIKVDDAVKTN